MLYLRGLNDEKAAGHMYLLMYSGTDAYLSKSMMHNETTAVSKLLGYRPPNDEHPFEKKRWSSATGARGDVADSRYPNAAARASAT